MLDKFIAHRGISKIYPENTAASIKAAKKAGIGSIEIDVMTLRDLVPIVFHDFTFDRCTNISGRVKNYFYQEVSTTDIGSWFSPKFKKEKLMTLKEVLFLIKRLNLKLNLEIKEEENDDSVKVILDVIKEAEFNYNKLIISSFNQNILSSIKRIDSKINIGCLFEKVPPNWQNLCSNLCSKTIICDGHLLKKEQCLRILKNDFLVYCYTINEKHLSNKLLKWGVNGIISDNPLTLI